jgi:UDP-N-acetylglucosamine 2-epimerase (non-hydrolysing)
MITEVNQKKIIIVVGTRPNFIKIAPLMKCFLKQKTIKPILVHTGQHYDIKMSGQFFTDLNIPIPDINLEVGSGSHATQTARIIERFENVCYTEKPDFVFVVGDVNSTVACALVAVKLGIKVIHYEAGLRSYDRSMPEEINRIVTDSISDFYFTTSDDATDNLIKENVSSKKIFMLGNLMIDTLFSQLPKAIETKLDFLLYGDLKIVSINSDFEEKKYGIVTLHRPSNVDSKESLTNVLQILGEVSKKTPLIFPIHFRTLKNIQDWDLLQVTKKNPNLFIIEALGYLEFLHLLFKSLFVITDSGGIQEETTYFDIPCLTLRPNTERPITVLIGSNKLTTIENLSTEVDLILKGMPKKRQKMPKFWDGKTANRILRQLQTI